MSARVVALAEIRLKAPAIVTRKVGKGWFYSSLYGIPGSTLLGALSREAILENVRNKRGQCAHLTSPNERPLCDVCKEVGCAYVGLWKEQKIKVSDALPAVSETPRLGEARILPELQSVSEARRRRKPVDGLLFTVLQKMALTDKAPKGLLTRSLRAEGEETKRKPTTVLVSPDGDGKVELKKWPRVGYIAAHVSINPGFRTAEGGLLFSISAHPEESRFLCTIIADGELLDKCVRDREVRLGAAKSRGYGLATIGLLEEKTIDAYLETRSNSIAEGFDRIHRFLSSLAVEAHIGTVTGLSPLSLVHGDRVLSPSGALCERIGLSPISLVASMYRHGVRPRWDGEELILTPSLNAGYVAAFQLQGDLQDASSRLARAEVELLDEIPGYGWIYVNHPVHYGSQASW